jgi:hypothetical protein
VRAVRADDVPEALLAAVRAVEIHRYWETGGTKAIKRHLGLPESETPYPPGCDRGLCDLVVPVEGGGVWTECKFAWTYKTKSHVATGRNSSYWPHLFGGGGKKHTALHDVTRKLPSLVGKDGVRAVAFLLVVFDSVHVPFDVADVAKLETDGVLDDARGWRRADLAPWPNPFNPRGEAFLRAYCWQRPAA